MRCCLKEWITVLRPPQGAEPASAWSTKASMQMLKQNSSCCSQRPDLLFAFYSIDYTSNPRPPPHLFLSSYTHLRATLSLCSRADNRALIMIVIVDLWDEVVCGVWDGLWGEVSACSLLLLPLRTSGRTSGYADSAELTAPLWPSCSRRPRRSAGFNYLLTHRNRNSSVRTPPPLTEEVWCV